MADLRRAWIRADRHGSQSTADSMAILDRHWQTMMTIIESDTEGPWMQAVTSGGLRPIDLA